MEIRTLRTEEYTELIHLWKESGLSFRPNGRDSREHIQIELKNGISQFLVASVGGQLIGSVIATHDGRKGWINRLCVHTNFRRMGLAQRLICEAENWLYKQGIEIIACMVEKENNSSFELFEKVGYQKYPINYMRKVKKEDV